MIVNVGTSLPNEATFATYAVRVAHCMVMRMKEKPAPTLRELYPHLNDEQLAEVEDTLERYLTVALRIFERQEAEERLRAGELTPDAEEIPYDLQEDSNTLA